MLVFLGGHERHMTYDSLQIRLHEWTYHSMNFEACQKNLTGQTHQRSEVGYIRCCPDSLMIIYPPKINMSRRREPFQKETSCSNHCFSGFQRCTCYDHVTFMSLFQPTQVKIGIINHMSDLPKTPLTRTKHPQMTLVWLLCCCLFFWKQGAFQSQDQPAEQQ